MESHALAHDIGAGGVVAEALALGGEEGREERRSTGERIDLDEPDEGSHERVLERDRAGVVADRPQAARELAQGAAAAEPSRRWSGRRGSTVIIVPIIATWASAPSVLEGDGDPEDG